MNLITSHVQRLAPPTGAAYYRCRDCLGICTLPVAQARAALTCGACTGTMEFLGHAQRDRLTKRTVEVPCDTRCTNAAGPSCDCRCGAANHGSGLLVEVEVDAGPVPRATPRERVAGDLFRKAQAYRALRDAAQAAWDARYKAVSDRKRAGEYLASGEFAAFCKGAHWAECLRAARAMRSHAGRNKRLADLTASLNGNGAH